MTYNVFGGTLNPTLLLLLHVVILSLGVCLMSVEFIECVCVCAVDETPGNCKMFIDGDGFNVFLACFNVCYTCRASGCVCVCVAV